MLQVRRYVHTEADVTLARFGRHTELRQRLDDRMFQGADEGAHVAEAACHIEHDIADPLTGTVIGVLAAAARAVNRKAIGLEEAGRFGAGAGRVDGRVLEQPDELGRFSRGNGVDALLHERACQLVGHGPGRQQPFDGRAVAVSGSDRTSHELQTGATSSAFNVSLVARFSTSSSTTTRSSSSRSMMVVTMPSNGPPAILTFWPTSYGFAGRAMAPSTSRAFRLAMKPWSMQ